MPTLTKLYTMQETSKHNSKDDCWVVVDGKIYDVTTYLDEHPGGDDVLIAATGKDATDDFEDAGHSEDAKELMEKYCVGELDNSAPELPELEVCRKDEHPEFAKKLMKMTKLYWAVPVVILGVSVVLSLVLHRKN